MAVNLSGAPSECPYCGFMRPTWYGLPEWHACPYREAALRDQEFAEAVKRGDLPGKVPEHYAKDWSPR